MGEKFLSGYLITSVGKVVIQQKLVFFSSHRIDTNGLLARLMMIGEDQILPNIRFAGAYGPRAIGFSSTYVGGDLAAKLTLGDMKEEK